MPGLITDIQIANVKQDGTIINNYGSRLYDFNTRYLKPKITLRPFKESGTYTVYVKMFKNNVLSTGSSSPAGFSYSDEITLSGSSSQTFYLSGWGSDSDGHWEEGDYRVEVWYGNYCIGSTTFEVR